METCPISSLFNVIITLLFQLGEREGTRVAKAGGTVGSPASFGLAHFYCKTIINMGLFSFIETFFFISLAITFVLILLLVYHFKQRIITVEQKCDTMFDIINTMLQEIQYLRVAATQRPPSVSFPLPTGLPTAPIYQQYRNLEGDAKQDIDDSSSESGSESESESESESDSESESESVSESEAEVIKKILLFEPTSSAPPPLIQEDDTIKLVNMENEVQLDELPIEQDLEVELESEHEDLAPISTEESIVVEKVDEVAPLEESPAVDEEQKDAKEVYSKMSTATLKQLVVQKGLSSEASKIRRPELLKMLESA